MDERKYRTYAKEFKLEALELLKRGDKSAGEIERQLGITPGLLVKWRAQVPGDPRGTSSAAGTERPGRSQGGDPSLAARAVGGRGGARDPKKSAEHLLTKKRMKYAFMAAHEQEFSLKRMCKVLGVSRSGYYAWKEALTEYA